MWLESQLKCLIFSPRFLSKNDNNVPNAGKVILNCLPIRKFMGLSSLLALHSFVHLIRNMSLTEPLCHYVGYFESTFTQFCIIILF